MGYFFLCDKDGNILQVDGTNLVVKIGDGTNIAEVDDINGAYPQTTMAQHTISHTYGIDGITSSRVGAHVTNADGKTAAARALEVAARLEAFNGTSFDRLRSDLLTKTLINTSYAHHKVHQASAYSNYLYASIAGTSNLDLLIRVGAAKTAHITFEVSAASEAFLYLIENPTVTVQGTIQPEYNRNRDVGTDNANAVCYHTSTTAGGTTLLQKYIPAGHKSGSHAGERAEWILKKSEDYILRITNIGAGANKASMQLSWYEE